MEEGKLKVITLDDGAKLLGVNVGELLSKMQDEKFKDCFVATKKTVKNNYFFIKINCLDKLKTN